MRTPIDSPMAEALKVIRAHSWPAVIFGGLPRDLMVYGVRARPRDIDIVVDNASISEIASVFKKSWVKRTRFGGLKLYMNKCLFDIWPLSETWAFRGCSSLGKNFADLPKTTFLNVEAVAVQMDERFGKDSEVFSAGFFEALKDKTIEINWAENPFPQLAVVRSLITAANLNFSLGPKLAEYIIYHGKRAHMSQLMEAQFSHYGRRVLSDDAIRTSISIVEEHVDRSPDKSVPPLNLHSGQMTLW